MVSVGAAEAGKNQRALPVNDVAAVEFRADLHRQIAVAQSFGSVRKVRGCQGKVATQSDEDLHLSAMHRLDCRHRSQAMLPWWFETADIPKAIEKTRART